MGGSDDVVSDAEGNGCVVEDGMCGGLVDRISCHFTDEKNA